MSEENSDTVRIQYEVLESEIICLKNNIEYIKNETVERIDNLHQDLNEMTPEDKIFKICQATEWHIQQLERELRSDVLQQFKDLFTCEESFNTALEKIKRFWKESDKHFEELNKRKQSVIAMQDPELIGQEEVFFSKNCQHILDVADKFVKLNIETFERLLKSRKMQEKMELEELLQEFSSLEISNV